MNREQKHQLSKRIVSTIERTQYYRNAIDKMKRHPKTFYEGTFEIRLMGTRSAIWGSLSIEDCISILTKKLKQELAELEKLEKQMK